MKQLKFPGLTEDTLKLTKVMFGKLKSFFWIIYEDIKGNMYFAQVNNTYASFYGKNINDFEGKKVKDILPQKEYHELKNNLQITLNKGSYFYNTSINTKFGEKHFIARLYNSRLDNNTRMYLCVYVDITKQEKMLNDSILNSRRKDVFFQLSNEIAESSNLNILIKKFTIVFSKSPEVLAGDIYFYNKSTNQFYSSRPFGIYKNLIKTKSEIKINDKEIKNIKGSETLIKKYYSEKKRILYNVKILLKIKNETLGILQVIIENKDKNTLMFLKHISTELSRGMFRIITETAHSHSLEKFFNVFNLTPDAVAISSVNNPTYIEVNDGFLNLTGFEKDEIIGKPVILSGLWINYEEREKMLKELEMNKLITSLETVLKTKNGSYINVLFSAKLINYEGKKAILTIVKNITDLKRAEQEIIISKEMLEKISSTSPSYISVYEINSDKIIYSNKSILAKLGYEKDDLERINKMSVDERKSLYHPDDIKTIDYIDKEILNLKENNILSVEYRLKDKNGKWNWFEHTSAVFQRDKKGIPTHSVNIVTPIEERKKSEEIIRTANEQIKTLYEAGKELSGTLDLMELYDRMFVHVSKIIDCNELFVARYDEQKQLIKYYYLRTKLTEGRIDVSKIPPIPLAPPGYGILSEVIRRGESIIFNDYQEEFSKKSKTHYTFDAQGNITQNQDTDQENENKPQSALIIPIKLDNKVFAVVQIFSKQKNAYTNSQVEFLESLMHQVALANKNVLLYEQAQQEIQERIKIEKSLKNSEERLRIFTESVPDVLYKLNFKTNKYEFLSQNIELLTGYPLKNFIDNPMTFHDSIVLKEDKETARIKFDEFLKSNPTNDTPFEIVLRLKRVDGKIIHVRDVSKYEMENGKIISSIGVLSDITERIKNEQEIIKSLNDKELLLREIHHRVKNNLQIVTSLLYLQSRRTDNQQVINALRDSEQRIKSMGLVHEKLYRSEDFASIDYAEYITSLTNSLFSSYSLKPHQINLILKIQKINLGIDKAIQCGLIINELVSNAIKHAFPNNKRGSIEVIFSENTNKEFELIVKDDGVGLKSGINIYDNDTLGVLLIKTIVEQIKGQLDVTNKNGCTFKITFPSEIQELK